MATNFAANVIIHGRLRCLTGLHIGASGRGGGLSSSDYPVVRDSTDDYPYVPGSSLRGRLRSLLAASMPGEAGATMLTRLFGRSAGPVGAVTSRLIVRDAFPTRATREQLDRLVREKGLPAVEIKAETALNRLTGEAQPRMLERVPAGSEFDLTFVYSVYDVDGDKASDVRGIGEVIRALRLLEDSSLGGGGSRGSGQVAVSLAVTPIVRDPRSYLEIREPSAAAHPPAVLVAVGQLDASAYLNTIASALNVTL